MTALAAIDPRLAGIDFGTLDIEAADLSAAQVDALLTREERAANEKRFWRGDVARAKSTWGWHGRPGQKWPAEDWRTWLVMAGRGFGKTRIGAEWVRVAAGDPRARIALVGATLHEARAVMVEGESGVLRVGTPRDRPVFEPSNRLLRWPSGAEARLYSAEDPDMLRGAQHSHAWGDEIAKWPHGPETWMNLRTGLRLGEAPRAVLTTTPRPVALVKALVADAGVEKRVGTTSANAANLAPGFVEALAEAYGGTRLGRQELEGELIEDVEGALWTRGVIEGCRVRPFATSGLCADRTAVPHPNPSPEGEGLSGRVLHEAPLLQGRGWGGAAAPGLSLRRIVVAVDPPASSNGDACGIVVAGLDGAGVGHVLADLTVEKAAPAVWAAAVAGAVEAFGAERVVAEANNGGEMVASVLSAAGLALPVKLVRASRGKAARAEPIAALYAAGRVKHHGAFPALEDQLCGLVAGGGYEGPGRSPDRADALVWALTELMLGPAPKRFGIRML